MRKIKHYTEKIPEELREKVINNLGKGLKKNATYGDLFDYLHDKGYIIELSPFYTFALVDNTAYVLKVFNIDYKRGGGSFIYDESEEYHGGGYGGSFWLQVYNAVDIIIKDFNGYYKNE